MFKTCLECQVLLVTGIINFFMLFDVLLDIFKKKDQNILIEEDFCSQEEFLEYMSKRS